MNPAHYDLLRLKILYWVFRQGTSVKNSIVQSLLVSPCCEDLEFGRSRVAGGGDPSRYSPQSPAAIRFFVGGADEHALPRLVHVLAASRWSVAIDIAHQKFLELVDRGAAIGAQFGDLDQPLAAQMQACILVVEVG
jgi:hypothetical protein